MTKYRSVGIRLSELSASPQRTYLDSLHIDLRCELEEVFHVRLGDPFLFLEELLYFARRQDERKEEL
jgi:hypothetical protein